MSSPSESLGAQTYNTALYYCEFYFHIYGTTMHDKVCQWLKKAQFFFPCTQISSSDKKKINLIMDHPMIIDVEFGLTQS